MALLTAQVAYATDLPNPLGMNDIASLIAAFLKAIVQLALPVVALFVVIAGFRFVSARGAPDKIKNARENLLWVVIGAALILGAWVLVNLIEGTVRQITG